MVDDETVRAKVLAQILKVSGYEAGLAEDGFEALVSIDERQPDLIISDLRMPNMSGFELLSVVRRRFPEIPVIATSGDYEPLVLPPCVVCDAFFKKASYQPPELLAKVAELLGGEIVQPSGRVIQSRFGFREAEMTTTLSPVRIACVHFRYGAQRKKSTPNSTHLVSTAKRY